MDHKSFKNRLGKINENANVYELFSEPRKKPLLTELAECFLKECLQYFYDIFVSKI